MAKKNKRKHPVLKVLLSFVLLIVLAAAGAAGWVYAGLQAVQVDSEEVTFEVSSSQTARTVAERLKEEGIVRNADIAYYYSRYKKLSDIKAGSFLLDKSWDLQHILEVLNDSSEASQDQVTVSVIEGDWCKDIAWRFEQVTNVTAEELIALWNNREWIESMMDEYPFLTEEMFQDDVRIYMEGYLAPETYSVNAKTTAEEITCRMLDQSLVIYEEFEDRIKANELSVHEIYTLASIVQYEGGGTNDEVLKKIASVFFNRMDAGMNLGSSVTVCYAIDFDRQEDDWQACEVNGDFDSPYNTYMHTGLPPGGIENAGRAALEAVMDPLDTDYYYFMADVLGDGTVYFAETYEEHSANVAKYLQ